MSQKNDADNQEIRQVSGLSVSLIENTAVWLFLGAGAWMH